ncbi:MAG: S-methyl-5-thioribose-1-phosphate isomerase [Elusimicrobia bacterium]|nr:S-methyl-5-thioribose-1-phosphate isomerase [Elusimicrobiota bacterium]MBK7207185.1 S-methyl-5-thioribose-1-phosphate isomerase [Elusimicrobiota bacterium]MBK7545991.1 S-methyl-5-thioribose-1-phosphate isomerase [Elusimicrobiota bacterium]MBK7574867.1 S-methyl-5-thioribose-1-phosphate isomerase [Elusimicrobiota bacterium]MBK7687483.1 S-methyl-5-thioribose-1-phosphate isomerase [Elusimicrobiota bacterium]
MPVVPFRWRGSRLEVLEQRDLPARVRWISCRTVDDVARAIRDMSIRGAPAIGCAAAFGLALAARAPGGARRDRLEKARRRLAATRPTAVNLFGALERMARVWKTDSRALSARLENEAVAIAAEDRAACRLIGDHGAGLLPPNTVVLTHCNAGALATAGYGTALGIVRSAHARGNIKKVYIDETRPYLQGARLTAWELARERIPYEILTDNAAAHILKTEKVDAVIVGADRIAANGDTANKIGTYALAIASRHHGVPFYVAAPASTIDPSTKTGDGIPIEERPAAEVLSFAGRRVAPAGARARHPAFDVTPAAFIAAIVTERGVVRPPFRFK